MRQKILLLILAAMLAFATGCGKEEEVPQVPENVPEEEEVIEEIEEEPAIPEGMVRSYLTGEWIDEEIAGSRPYAIMIGNTVDALPQYGIANADVYYEVPVEGGIQRLMAIFQDVSGLEKIGSVRSCRHYFVYFAKEFDAIYVHHGQTPYAEPILSQYDNLNGMELEGTVFYRDPNRKNPHNSFTGEEELAAGMEKKEYRTEYAEEYEGRYQFAEDDAPVVLNDGENAIVVSPGYTINKPWFVYNEDEELYYRYQFKQEHMDAAIDEQLKVKNILIQYCDIGTYPGDKNGYLEVNTLSGGEGKYITNGKMIDITWTKENENSPARYFDASGNEITINQGKTWVCIMRSSDQSKFQVYDTEEELQEARAAQ